MKLGSRARVAVAIAASVLLHALLLAWLILRVERLRPRPAPREVEVEIQTAKPGPPERPPSASRGPATAPPAGTVRERAPPRRAGTPEWLRENGVGPGNRREGAARGAPFVPGEVREGLARGVGPEAPAGRSDPSRGEGAEKEAQRAKGRVDAFLSDLKASERAQATPHPYWAELRERLERDFKPDWDTLARSPAGTGEVVKGVIGSYTRQGEAYARTGNPYGAGSEAHGATRSLADDTSRVGAGDHGLSEGWQMMLGMGRGEGGTFSTRLETLIEMTQSEAGEILDVKVVRSSGNRAHDEAALEQAHALARSPLRPSAPPQGRVTRWAFATELRIVPPVPVAGFTYDPVLKKGEATYPLKRIAHSSVKLVGIY